MIDLLREIFQSLSTNKGRTALTGIAVAWGIFMLIVLLGMSRGVTNSFTSFVTIDNARSLSVYGGYTSRPYKGYREGRKIEPENADINKVIGEDPAHIETVTAAKTIDTAKVSSGREYISDQIYGHFPAELQKARLEMKAGRFLNDRDMAEKRRVMVLNSQNAATLFGDAEKAVGQRVTAMGLSWLVIGVYDHRWERSSYVPYTTAMFLSGNDGKVSDLYVKITGVKTEADGEAVEQTVREAMGRAHGFAPDDESAVHVWNRFTSYLKQMTAMNILEVAVWVIGVFTLLSGIVGVSNIMFVSVRERTHEIGIRRAIGAKPRNILVQIVAESVAITTLFGYIGIAAGMAVTGLIDYLTRNQDFIKDPTVDISIAVKVTVVLIVAGAVAGLFPALKATKVKPVEALRDE